MKQTLRQLIAKGKTKEVIAELMHLTAYDIDLNNEVNILSARFTKYKTQYHLGLEDSALLNIESNRINNALLDIIDRLDTEGGASTTSEVVTRSYPLTTMLMAIGASIMVLLVVYFKFCGNSPEGGDGKPFSVVVYTHGIGGRQDILQLKETQLVADFGGRRDVATVGEHGQNTFNEIPAAFRDKRIGIGLEGTEGYVLSHKDSTYPLNGEPIYLAVQSSCRFCVVEGYVQNQESFIPNVVVNIDNFADTTDSKGYFKIDIPPNKELSEYAATISIKGKIVKRLFITPVLNKPTDILIE